MIREPAQAHAHSRWGVDAMWRVLAGSLSLPPLDPNHD